MITKTTYADGGTRIETYYRDGQLQSVAGTAVAPVRYVYGVADNGAGGTNAYTAEIKLDAVFADTSERMTNFVDMVGRNYKTAYSAASGTPFAISYWNNKGQLTNQVDPDGVSQLYVLNPKGEPAYTITDSNRNYTIDYSGDDRSYVTNDVVNNGTADVQRTRTYVWNTSANTSNLVIFEPALKKATLSSRLCSVNQSVFQFLFRQIRRLLPFVILRVRTGHEVAGQNQPL